MCTLNNGLGSKVGCLLVTALTMLRSELRQLQDSKLAIADSSSFWLVCHREFGRVFVKGKVK